MQQQHNPYKSAAGAYGTNAQKHADDPRETEARVLLKSAQFMQDLQNNWAAMTGELLEETIKYNRNIWMMFYDTAVEDPATTRPDDLRAKIVSLANFVFKRGIDIMAKPTPEKLDVLIKINRDIAGGLMKGVAADKANNNNVTNANQSGKPPSSGGTDHSA